MIKCLHNFKLRFSNRLQIKKKLIQLHKVFLKYYFKMNLFNTKHMKNSCNNLLIGFNNNQNY